MKENYLADDFFTVFVYILMCPLIAIISLFWTLNIMIVACGLVVKFLLHEDLTVGNYLKNNKL